MFSALETEDDESVDAEKGGDSDEEKDKQQAVDAPEEVEEEEEEEEEAEHEPEAEIEVEDIFSSLTSFSSNILQIMGTSAEPMSEEDRLPRPLSPDPQHVISVTKLLQVSVYRNICIFITKIT